MARFLELLTQLFFIPTAKITEQNCQDQSNRVSRIFYLEYCLTCITKRSSSSLVGMLV